MGCEKAVKKREGFVKILYLFALVLLVVLLFLFDRVKKANEELVIGTNTWPGYEILYVAREKGFIEKDNIKLVEYNTTSEVLRGMQTGVINAGALTLDEAIKAYDRGLDILVVLVFDYSYGADVVIAKDYIEYPLKLKGKRIGVEKTALGKYMLKRFLEINNMREEDVNVVYLELHQHARAFLNGEIDAVITFEPEKSKILSKEGKVIFSSKQIPMEIIDVLVVDRKFLKENKWLVKELIDGYYQAFDFFINNKPESLKIMAQREKISIAQLEKALTEIYLPSKEKVIHNYVAIEHTVKTLCNYLKEKNEIKKTTNCNQILDRALMEELLK